MTGLSITSFITRTFLHARRRFRNTATLAELFKHRDGPDLSAGTDVAEDENIRD
jgi:hypothetical protein